MPATVLYPNSACVDIINLKANMVDAELHGLAFDHAAEAEDRNIKTAIGEINTALSDPDLLQAECVFVEGGSFFGVMSADRDVFDLSHDPSPFFDYF